MKQLVICNGFPRSGTTSLWRTLKDNHIIDGPNEKEIHYLSMLHNDFDIMYPPNLLEPHRKYVALGNKRAGLTYPYNLDNYIAYLNSFSNPSDFSQSYNLLPEDFLCDVKNKLQNYFKLKVLLIFREPVSRLISQIGMIQYNARFFGVDIKNDRDLFMEYINNPKVQSLYRDVHDKYVRVFGDVMCLTTEHFFVNEDKQNKLAKFLGVPIIWHISKPQNVGNYKVELSHDDLELAKFKLKDSIDFYATLIS